MQIQVNQVRKDDYVVGFGTVVNVRVFYSEKAVKTKVGPMNRQFIPLPDKTAYARLIAEQQENSYDRQDGTVILYTAFGSKSYHANEVVDVYRVERKAA